MKKYLLIISILIFLNLTLGMSKETKIISENLPELNAAPYYAKAIQLVNLAQQEEKINIIKYQKDMEEAIKNIEEGNNKPFYIPPRNYFTRITEKENFIRSDLSKQYAVAYANFLEDILDLYDYIKGYKRQLSGELPKNKKWYQLSCKYLLKFNNEKELQKFIKNEESLAIFVQRIMYNPFPHTDMNKIGLLGGVLCGICKDLDTIYKNYGYTEESNSLINYSEILKRKIDIINLKNKNKKRSFLSSFLWNLNYLHTLFNIF